MPTVGRNVVHARWLNRFHAHWLKEQIIRKFLIVDVNLRIIPFSEDGAYGANKSYRPHESYGTYRPHWSH